MWTIFIVPLSRAQNKKNEKQSSFFGAMTLARMTFGIIGKSNCKLIMSLFTNLTIYRYKHFVNFLQALYELLMSFL